MASQKATPLTPRFAPSVINYHDSKCLVVSGEHPVDSERLKSVDIYDFEDDTWTHGPDVVQARKYLSGCCHGSYAFIFGGIVSNGTILNSMERLNVDQWLEKGNLVSWETLNLTSKQDMICPRVGSAVTSFNSSQILLFGGSDGNCFQSDGYAVDAETGEIQQIFNMTGGFFSKAYCVSSFSNQTIRAQAGLVKAIVVDKNFVVQTVSYR